MAITGALITFMATSMTLKEHSGIQHLAWPASLQNTNSPNSLSVLSYNVLLPNSQDGWWTYKNYYPPADLQITTWNYRQELIKTKIQSFGYPDVICLQEVAPDSFKEDFDFLTSMGYDSHVLYRKGRFRPATFWKSAKCKLVHDPVHRDRCLLTCFTTNTQGKVPTWHILNCHLQAGQNAPRRLRQLEDGIGAIVKLEKKIYPELKNDQIRAIVCGDFNGDDECAAIRFITDGVLTSDFIEDGAPVTSKTKTMPLGPMTDVVAAACSLDSKALPPTLVVPELISVMVAPTTTAYNSPQLSDELKQRLTKIYNKFATDCNNMSTTDVEKWLTCINGKVGRGSEFRCAAKLMGWTSNQDDDENTRIELPPNSQLSLEHFFQVYLQELMQGKFWGIAHDLCILGEPIIPLKDIKLYQGRIDRMFCTPATLTPTCVVSTFSDKPCPNENEPSDHLPVVASFKIK